MVAKDSSKVYFSRLLASLLLAVLTILISSASGFTRELPRVALKCPPGIQQSATPFTISIIVSWKGDAETHLVIPPEPVFPKSFNVRSSSFEADVRDAHHQLTYRFTLMARQTGQFTIFPVDIRCWPRSSSTELSLVTNECSITVDEAGLSQKKMLAATAVILFIMISACVYMIKKRSTTRYTSSHPEAEASGKLLIQQCRDQHTRGDYAAFYTTALQAAHTLLPSDHNLSSRITANLERTRFSKEKPSAEDADYVLRRLEHAFNHGHQQD